MTFKDPERKRQYDRDRRQKCHDAWFWGKSCAWCGSVKDLQLDHIDPSQKVDHRVWSWSPTRRQRELAKCQPLCVPCHREKTLAQRRKTTHGTIHMYQAYRCRCDLCVQKKRDSYRV